jgi:CRP-like cAMP-binding protein
MADRTRKGTRPDLAKSPTFTQLRPETRDALEAMCRVKSYHANQTVTYAQEKPDFIGCVLTGILRIQKTLADGREHIVGLLVEGDVFGRVFDGAAEFSIEAATDTEICAFPRAEFEALLFQSPDLERAVLLNITNELDRAREWLIILSNHKMRRPHCRFPTADVFAFSRYRPYSAAKPGGHRGQDTDQPGRSGPSFGHTARIDLSLFAFARRSRDYRNTRI